MIVRIVEGRGRQVVRIYQRGVFSQGGVAGSTTADQVPLNPPIAGLPATAQGAIQSLLDTGVRRHTPVASINLSALRAITVNSSGEAIYANSGTLSHAHKVLGISLQTTIAGQSVRIYDNEVVSDNSWSWIPDNPIFLGLNGALVQTPPTLPSSLFLLRLGVALSSTSVEVEIQEPLILTLE